MIIAIGAGIRIGAAFFDLIPEAIEHLGSLQMAMLWTAVGFLAFYAIDKLTTLHVGHETAAELDHDDAHPPALGRRRRRPAWASTASSTASPWRPAWPSAAGSASSSPRSSSSIASATGSAWSASCSPAGAPKRDRLSLADPRRRRARRGVLLGLDPARSRTTCSARSSAFFAGFFLYVGAAELLPEAHRRDRSRWSSLATIGGAVAIYAFSVAVGAIGIDAH